MSKGIIWTCPAEEKKKEKDKDKRREAMRETLIGQLIRPGVTNHGNSYAYLVHSLLDSPLVRKTTSASFVMKDKSSILQGYKDGFEKLTQIGVSKLDLCSVPSLLKFIAWQIERHDTKNTIRRSSSFPTTTKKHLASLIPRRHATNVCTTLTDEKLGISILRAYLASRSQVTGRSDIDIRPVISVGYTGGGSMITGGVVLDVISSALSFGRDLEEDNNFVGSRTALIFSCNIVESLGIGEDDETSQDRRESNRRFSVGKETVLCPLLPNFVSHILAIGVTLLVSQKVICPGLSARLEREGCRVVQRVGISRINRCASVTGGAIHGDWRAFCELKKNAEESVGIEEMKQSAKLGVGRLAQFDFGTRKMLVLLASKTLNREGEEGARNPVPVVLPLGVTDSFAAGEIKRIAEACIEELERACTEGGGVGGGGAGEILSHGWLQEFMRTDCIVEGFRPRVVGDRAAALENFRCAVGKCFQGAGDMRRRKMLDLVGEALEVAEIILNVREWDT